MCGTLTNQARREEWVSCVVLICFTLCIPTSALPAGPLPVVSGKPHGAKTYSGAQLSLDTRDRLTFNDSTVHCVMSIPNATATNIGGRPRPTISSFPSLLLTPNDFNSRSTASSTAPFGVNSTTTTASIPINQDRSESNKVVGATNNNVLSLPKFFDDDCPLWFSTIELIFRLQGVTQQNVKLQSVLAALHMSQLQAIETVMASPGPKPYDTVKSLLVRRFAKSETENLNQLLYTSRLLHDEKPSFHLQKLRKLMGSCPSDQDNRFLRRLFLDHLPSDVRRILTIYADESLDNLAQIADRLFDDEKRTISQTDKSNFRSTATPVAKLSASLDHMRRDLQFLRNDISSLNWRGVGGTSTTGSLFRTDSPAHFDSPKQLQNFTSNTFFNERNRRNFRSPPSRSVNKANSTENATPDSRFYCCYHSKFGAEARQCKQPCKFNSSAVKTPQTSNGSVGACRNETSTWHIYDPLTNIDFCLDSGSNKSLLPAHRPFHDNRRKGFFRAANGTLIPYFEEVEMTVSLGYDKTFTWMFVMANVTNAILGCDFLQHFNVALDFGKHELIFQNVSRPNTASLDVKDVDLYDRDIGLSKSNSMSTNSFESHMKPAHYDRRDSLHEKQDGDFFTPVESELAADWSQQTHHQTRYNQALHHKKKARNHVTNTSGNHKLIKQSEALIAKTDSNTVEDKTLSSSLNVHAKPFEPDHALHVADVVRVNKSIEELCEHFECLFNLDVFRAPSENQILHYIRTTGPPCCARVRRLSPEKLDILKTELNKLIELDVVYPSESPWGSPVHLVPKSGGGSWRIVCDYRALNKQTIPDSYALPHLTDFANDMAGSKFFTSLDLFKSFHQIVVAPEDQQKAVMVTPLGSFAYRKMPMGLCNASQSFQKMMNNLLRSIPNTFCYVDDILIYSNTFDEHVSHLRAVFERLKAHNLVLNRDKCVFAQQEITFLGHLISTAGVAPLPS